MNPVQDETIILLRRLVKLLESNAVVDANNRQRVAVETLPAVSIASSQTLATVSTVSTISAISTQPVDQRYQIIDAARLTYNEGIRSHLTFS